MTARRLEMKFAGALVQHLGLQMYSGPISAIAELIANAWDADATHVSVAIPLDEAITQDLEIAVADDGLGMTFEDVNDLYLVVGRNRRASGGYSPGGRRVLGRKGIGKLAGFGIARIVEVWTVRDGHLTAFRLDYDRITRHGAAEITEPYEPELLDDRPVTADDPIQQGTLVVLKRLQLKNAIAGDRFRSGMARRFGLLSAQFQVDINGVPLEREEQEFQFRFPPTGVATDNVPGLGDVSWWMGFTETPIRVEEARGIAVLARGKLVQAPFFFDLSGGVQGQHGMQYLAGEVLADQLDEDDADLVATNRASVLWEDPRAAALLKWGQDKVRELLREWTTLRFEKHKETLRDTTPYMDRVSKFPEREQRELVKAIETLAKIETIEDDRLKELVDILIRAFENDHFMNVIRALNAAEDGSYEEISRLIEEWDVIEAINTAQVVRGRVEVIRTFRSLIETGAPEKPDMQDFLKDHPWLIDPAWQVLQHERSLEKVVADQFGLDASDDAESRRRLDFFCLGDSSLAVVVEAKRPGDLIGRRDLQQLEDYVDFLRRWNNQSTGTREKRAVIRGCLIYSRLKPDAEEKRRRLVQDGIEVVTWEQLLETAERLHKDFLEVVKARAPQEDPRIQSLDETATPPDIGEITTEA